MIMQLFLRNIGELREIVIRLGQKGTVELIELLFAMSMRYYRG